MWWAFTPGHAMELVSLKHIPREHTLPDTTPAAIPPARRASSWGDAQHARAARRAGRRARGPAPPPPSASARPRRRDPRAARHRPTRLRHSRPPAAARPNCPLSGRFKTAMNAPRCGLAAVRAGLSERLRPCYPRPHAQLRGGEGTERCDTLLGIGEEIRACGCVGPHKTGAAAHREIAHQPPPYPRAPPRRSRTHLADRARSS